MLELVWKYFPCMASFENVDNFKSLIITKRYNNRYFGHPKCKSIYSNWHYLVLIYLYFSPFYYNLIKAPRKIRKDSYMVVYEFYSTDDKGDKHLIGILPERRQKPERITTESIMNWGRKLQGDNSGIKDIYFTEVNV